MEEKTSEKSSESVSVSDEDGELESYFRSLSAAPSSMASSSKVKTVNDSVQHQNEESREKINKHPQSNYSNFSDFEECGQCKFPIPTAKFKSHQRKKHNFRCEAYDCNLAFRAKSELCTHGELAHGEILIDEDEFNLVTNGDDQKTVPNESPGGNKELQQTRSNKPQLALIVDSEKSEKKTVLATEDRPGQRKSLRKTVRVRI